MELFNYEDIGFLGKYSREIYIGCLAVTLIVTLVWLIVAFKKYGFFKKLIECVIALVVGGVLFVGSTWLHAYTKQTNEILEEYKTAYENGQVQTVSGKVENFTPSATMMKSFTINGVEFKIYASKHERFQGATEPRLYYTYSAGGFGYDFVFEQWMSTSENCVVLGDGQNLEIHYIEEDGEKYILYIKEITE